MDKIIVTVLLIVAGVVCCMAVFGAVYPAINRTSGAMVAMADQINERIESQIAVIAVADQADNVHVWVKNTGASRIEGIENVDIFFGEEGNFARIPFGSEGLPAPYWDYVIENDARWSPAATARFTIHLPSAPSGHYLVKVVIPTGVYDQKTFST